MSSFDMKQEFKYGPYTLILTCQACPEQYDVYNEDKQIVGYLRLRHGKFRCDVPGTFGETIYTAHPKGDGIFDDSEREHFLQEATNAIEKFYKEHSLEDTLQKYSDKMEKLYGKSTPLTF